MIMPGHSQSKGLDMAIGIHLKKPDIDNMASQLLRTFQSLQEQAAEMAAIVAPYTDTQFVAQVNANTNDANNVMTLADADNFISAASVVGKLVKVAAVNGTPDPGDCATASQTAVLLSRFGGV